MRNPNLERALRNGIQRLYAFENGRGASVVRNEFSYGRARGLWELAVLKFQGKGLLDYGLDYSTPITDDVLGHLTEAEVDELLARIEALPPVEVDEMGELASELTM